MGGGDGGGGKDAEHRSLPQGEAETNSGAEMSNDGIRVWGKWKAW